MSRGHEQYEENVGAYLLGALPEMEAEVFEQHLRSCPTCRHDLEELRVASEALPRAVEPVTPPPELKESLMATVWAEAGEREEVPKAERPRRRPFRERLPRLTPGFAALATACVLAIGIGIGIGVANIGGSSTKTVAALVDHTQAPGGMASLSIPGGDQEGALLNVQGLPDPGVGKVYEVWVQRNGTMQPAGALFSVGSGGSGSAGIPASLKGAQAVAVTAERDGGTLKPTRMPVLTVKLS